MLVRLLSAVLHHGVHHDAGQCVDIDDSIAESLVSRGLADCPRSSEPTPEFPTVKRDPIAQAHLKEAGALNVPTGMNEATPRSQPRRR
jgi:hypothetical protein